MNKKKQRLDLLLVEKGLTESRNAASAMILAGEVMVAGQRADKPGQQVSLDAVITLKDRPRYVSRGGDKLASVANDLKLDFKDKIVLDVGSSTGGFTDFALSQGAAKVYCVDVGNAQLAYKLRQDPRVVVMERTDIRKVTLRHPERNASGVEGSKSLPEVPDMAVIDVSFISLIKILEKVAELVKPSGQIVAMMKPQFEAGKELADKYKGLILDEEVRQQVISDFRSETEPLFEILAEADSGLAGLHGNRERFFLLIKR